jgi:tetratricopeptide (TPR) repeat protein
MPPKRPLGLKKQEPNKKAKEEEIIVHLEGKDDMDELEQLYKQAYELLNTNEEQARLLFRGVVHECDKMVRIFNDQVEETEQFKQLKAEWKELPPDFYLIYGNGLYYLSLLDTKENIGFLELGLDMIERALETKDTEEIHHAKSRILIQLASLSDSQEKLEMFKKQMMKPFEKTDLYLELCHHCHRFADTIASFEDKKEWILMNQKNWQKVIAKDEDNTSALIGLGNGYLSLADEMIQLLEDGTLVNELKVQKYLEQALDSFKKALDITLRREENPTQLYLLLGETQVHLGNLLDQDDEESPESLGHYKQAVDSFQRVQSLDKDALPEQFEDFLNEWQQDMQ